MSWQSLTIGVAPAIGKVGSQPANFGCRCRKHFLPAVSQPRRDAVDGQANVAPIATAGGTFEGAEHIVQRS